jgi:hypothetical protein
VAAPLFCFPQALPLNGGAGAAEEEGFTQEELEELDAAAAATAKGLTDEEQEIIDWYLEQIGEHDDDGDDE